MGEYLLNVENLVVEYITESEVVHAVNGISFRMKKGETLGLVGETGAGKTTSALSIMRLLPPKVGVVRSGKIELDGENLLDLKEDDMRKIRGNSIAMIYQDPMTSLNPVLTIGDQILEVLQLHNEERKSERILMDRVNDLLELVGIPHERYTEYPHQFSGGMKQRVVIAMALACEPKFLIADEPTTALDVTIQAQVLKMIRDLKQKLNTAMLLITHDLGIIAQTCNNVAVMYSGEIIEYGTLRDIFKSKKHHPYTIGLFESIPKLNEDSPRLHPIEGMIPDPTNLPKGCHFSPRCKHCMEKCREMPPPVYREGNHLIACHLYSQTPDAGRIQE